MRQLQKQIEIKKKQKEEFETANSVIAKNITTIHADIFLIEEENKTIAFEIGSYAHTIEQLPKDFQPTFFQILLQIVSFGIKNYKKEYIAHLETLKNEKDELVEKLSSKKQSIIEIQKKSEQQHYGA